MACTDDDVQDCFTEDDRENFKELLKRKSDEEYVMKALVESSGAKQIYYGVGIAVAAILIFGYYYFKSIYSRKIIKKLSVDISSLQKPEFCAAIRNNLDLVDLAIKWGTISLSVFNFATIIVLLEINYNIFETSYKIAKGEVDALGHLAGKTTQEASL